MTFEIEQPFYQEKFTHFLLV